MNYRLISRVLGHLLFLLGIAMSVCVVYAVVEKELHPEANEAIRGMSLSTFLTMLAAAMLYYAGRPVENGILRKEAVAIVGLGWILCAAFGAIPYLLCKPALGPAAAFFESMSGFTTTGSTVIVDLAQYPSSVLLWRGLTQWLGGIGILVLFVAVLSFLGVGSKSLFRHESSGYGSGGFKTRIHETALTLFQIYLALTILCALGLMALGMSVYDGVYHAFTALSTGGFSPHNASIAHYRDPAIEMWLTLFMFLGGGSFMLYAWLLRGRFDRWRQEEELKYYFAILLLAFGALVADLVLSGIYESPAEAARYVVFQVVSLTTTTGFASTDYDHWPTFAKSLLVLLMITGGCAGSTAGGVKVSRVLLFFRIAYQELVAAFRPTQVIPLQLNGRTANESLKPQTLFFLCFTAFLIAAGTLGTTLMEPGMDLESALSSVVATLFNIGPGFGSVGPAMNFSGLHDATYLMLSLLMVLGRLELFAVLVLFLPSLWRRY